MSNLQNLEGTHSGHTKHLENTNTHQILLLLHIFRSVYKGNHNMSGQTWLILMLSRIAITVAKYFIGRMFLIYYVAKVNKRVYNIN